MLYQIADRQEALPYFASTIYFAPTKNNEIELPDPFLARGELSGWLENQDVRRKQWKFARFPIVSSSVGAFLHSLMVVKEYSYSDEMVKQKNLLRCTCNYPIVLIIRYITSLTQYLTYSTSLPQDTFD